MSAIPLWVRLTAWAALFIAGTWLGWKVETWREGAGRAAVLQAALDHERAANAASETARLKLAAVLARSAAAVQTQIKEVIKYVPRLIPDRRECDLPDDLVGVLNRARGYGVPSTGRSAPAATAAVAATP